MSFFSTRRNFFFFPVIGLVRQNGWLSWSWSMGPAQSILQNETNPTKTLMLVWSMVFTKKIIIINNKENKII